MAHFHNKNAKRTRICWLCKAHKLKCMERSSNKRRWAREHGVYREKY